MSKSAPRRRGGKRSDRGAETGQSQSDVVLAGRGHELRVRCVCVYVCMCVCVRVCNIRKFLRASLLSVRPIIRILTQQPTFVPAVRLTYKMHTARKFTRVRIEAANRAQARGFDAECNTQHVGLN
jgi:hypothetical protein